MDWGICQESRPPARAESCGAPREIAINRGDSVLWRGVEGARRSTTRKRRSGTGSVIGLQHLRRRLDDEDFLASIGIGLHDAVQHDALVVLGGDHGLHLDVVGEGAVGVVPALGYR